MNRRKRFNDSHEHPNLERWLVSYADFITLLFAFFVVMYAISSINEGKYRVLSESLSQIFSATQHSPTVEPRTLDPIQIGEIKRSFAVHDENAAGGGGDELARLSEAAEQIERVLAPYIQEDLIAVKREANWVEIEMKSALLFASGSAELSPTAIPMIDKLADIFAPLDNFINVEGHTDDRPINTEQFPSNWELSAARAASVVRQLMKGGVNPARMAAIGYGEYHPEADNSTEEGRFKNRRVVLVLQSKPAPRAQASNTVPTPPPPPPASPAPR